MLYSISAAHYGGGENFISLIQKELLQHINTLYPTAPETQYLNFIENYPTLYQRLPLELIAA